MPPGRGQHEAVKEHPVSDAGGFINNTLHAQAIRQADGARERGVHGGRIQGAECMYWH